MPKINVNKFLNIHINFTTIVKLNKKNTDFRQKRELLKLSNKTLAKYGDFCTLKLTRSEKLFFAKKYGKQSPDFYPKIRRSRGL